MKSLLILILLLSSCGGNNTNSHYRMRIIRVDGVDIRMIDIKQDSIYIPFNYMIITEVKY